LYDVVVDEPTTTKELGIVPSPRYTLNDVTLLSNSLHVSWTPLPFACVALRLVGATGFVAAAGVAETEVDAGPVPTPLIALTSYVY
jgi:hypothetical protein